jgi:hypothetical protein
MYIGWNAPSGNLQASDRKVSGSNPNAPEDLQWSAVGLQEIAIIYIQGILLVTTTGRMRHAQDH